MSPSPRPTRCRCSSRQASSPGRAEPCSASRPTNVPEGDTHPPRRPAAAGARRAAAWRSRRRTRARGPSGVAERIDGRRLDSVEAVGKNLVFRFEGGVVLRSHLRVSGRWVVQPRDTARKGLPWLVLRGDGRRRACSGTGRCSSCTRARCSASAPTSSRRRRRSTRCSHACAAPTRHAGSASRCSTRASSRASGTCGWPRCSGSEELSPWRRLGDVTEAERRAVLETAATLMAAAVAAGREPGRQRLPAGRAGRVRAAAAGSARGGRATTTG